MKRKWKLITCTLAIVLSVAMLISSVPLGALALEIQSNIETLTEEPILEELPAEIVEEVNSLRTADTKHFRMSDGSYQAVTYKQSVHYKDSNGKWRDIDSSLIEKTVKNKKVYSITQGDASITLPESFADNQKATLSRNGYSVAFGLSEENESVSLDSLAEIKESEELFSNEIIEDANLKAELIADGVSINKLDDEVKRAKKAEIKAVEKAAQKTPKQDRSETRKAEIEQKNEEIMTLDNLSSAVEYKNVLPKTNIEYIISPNQIKENIVIFEPQKSEVTENEEDEPEEITEQKNYTYMFKMDVGDLIPTAQENGSITLAQKGKANKPEFILHIPYMYDALGTYSFDVTQTLKKIDGEWILTIQADEEWINAESRLFPIVIDPTLSVYNASNINDTAVDTNSPNKNYNTVDFFAAGKYDTGYGIIFYDWEVCRAYLKLPTPTLPTNSIPTQALLFLNQRTNYNQHGDVRINAYQVRQDWNPSTITWSNQPSASFIDWNVVDSHLRNSGSTQVFDLTKLALNWYNGTEQNYGIMLQSDNENNSGKVAYHSTEASAGSPAFVVAYLSSYGMEDWFTYESFSADRAGVVYVNDYFRTPQIERSELTIGGGKMPVNITRSYFTTWNDGALKTNLNTSSNRPYGQNWKINYNQSLTFNNVNSYEHVGDKGQVNRFVKYSPVTESEDGKMELWVPELISLEMIDKVLWVPKGNNPPIKDIILETEKEIHKFNNSGLLVSIESLEEQNAKIEIEYGTGARIAQITDDMGRKYVFEYSGNMLIKIIAKKPDNTAIMADGKTPLSVQYSYDTNGNLSTVTYPDGEKVYYTYANNLLQLQNVNGDKIKLNLNNSRVTSAEKYTGNFLSKSVTITYNNARQNTFTDNFGNKFIKQFDSFGRTIAVIDGVGDYASSAYSNANTSTGERARGGLLAANGNAFVSINLLKNHSAEQTGTWQTLASGGASTSGINTADSAKSFAGSKSLCITNNSNYTNNGAQNIYQIIPTESWSVGDTLTLSGYEKIHDKIEKCVNNDNDDFGAALFISFCNSNGSEISTSNSKFNIMNDDKWNLDKITAQVPKGTTAVWVGVKLQNAKGTVYFDALQLEKGMANSSYNYVEDADFTTQGAIPSIINENITTSFGFHAKLADLGQSLATHGGKTPNAYTSTTSNVSATANYGFLSSSDKYVAMRYTGAKSAVETVLNKSFPNWNAYTAGESLYIRADIDNGSLNTKSNNKVWYASENNWNWVQMLYINNGTDSNGSHSISAQNVINWTNVNTPPNLLVQIQAGRDSGTWTGSRKTSYNPSDGGSYVAFSGNVTYKNPVHAEDIRDARLNNKALRLNGNQNNQLRSTVQVPVNAKAGEKYLVGVWARSTYALPTLFERSFGLTVNNSLGVKIPYSEINFDVYNPYWQYLQTVVEVQEDTSRLDVVFSYDYQRGQAYFDGLQVQKLDSSQIDNSGTPIVDTSEQLIPYDMDVGSNITNNVATDDLGRTIASRKTNGSVALYSFSDYDDEGNVIKTVDSAGSTVEFEIDNYAQLTRSYNYGGFEGVNNTGINILDNTEFEREHAETVNEILVKNPAIAENWSHHSSSSTGFTVERNEISKRTGNAGYSISRTINGTADVVCIYDKVVPGETYKLSGWFKVPTGSIGGNGAKLILEEIDSIGASVPVNSAQSTAKTSGDWQKFSTTITIPKTGGKFLRVKAQLDGIGTVYVDDLKLETVLQDDDNVAQAVTSTVKYNFTPMGVMNQVRQTVEGLTNGDALENNYVYEQDRLKSVSHNGFDYNFEYDSQGRQTAVKVGNSPFLKYTYDSAGNQTPNTITYANGQTISYTYDDTIGAITEVFAYGNADSDFIYDYDDNGILVSYTDKIAGTIARITDDGTELYSLKDNSPIYITSENNEVYLGQSYSHALGELPAYDSLSDNEKSVRQDEARNNITTAIIETSGAVNFTNTQKSDFFERVTSTQIQSEDLRLTNVFDYVNLSGNRTTEFVGKVTNLVGDNIEQSFSYTYDTKGNIISITSNDGAVSYTYDEAGQLKSETIDSGVTTWKYDKGGNIASKTLPSGTKINYTYDSTWKDKLVSYNGHPISYDTIGNPLSFAGNTLSWNGRQLMNFNGTSFTYDINGLRTSKTVDNVTTKYTWNDNRLVGQTDGTNTLFFLYEKTGGEIGFVLNGVDVYWYLKNLQGDITAIVDAEGNNVVQYSYDAWGVPSEPTGLLADTIGVLNPMRYRGYYYDSETRLYYCQSRYYNPQWGRWISLDEISVSTMVMDSIHATNLYNYCSNNPIAKSDWSGYWSGTLFGFINYNINIFNIRFSFKQEELQDFMDTVGMIGFDLAKTATMIFQSNPQVKDKVMDLVKGIGTPLENLYFWGADILDELDEFTRSNELAGRLTLAAGAFTYDLLRTLIPNIKNGVPGIIWGTALGAISGGESAWNILTSDLNFTGIALSDVVIEVLNALMDDFYDEKLMFTEPIRNILDAVSFRWDSEQRLWYTKVQGTWQSHTKYNDLYDELTPAIWFILDYEPIDIKIENAIGYTEYRVWLWKGNYGALSIGSEIGFYKKIKIFLPDFKTYDTLRETFINNGIDLTYDMFLNVMELLDSDSSVADLNWYEPMDKSEKDLVSMSMILGKISPDGEGEIFLARGPEYNWWLTAFKLGYRTRDDKLGLLGVIEFNPYWRITDKVKDFLTNTLNLSIDVVNKALNAGTIALNVVGDWLFRGVKWISGGRIDLKWDIIKEPEISNLPEPEANTEIADAFAEEVAKKGIEVLTHNSNFVVFYWE